MEVHVRNVPEQATEKSLRTLLKEAFKRLRISIDHVNCHKNRGKNNANLTFLLVRDGEFFLRYHGSTRPQGDRRSKPSTRDSQNLMFMGRPIYCEKSIRAPNPYLLRVLRAEAEKRKAVQVARIEKAEGPDVFPISFRCVSLSCGAWGYEDSNAVFSPQLQMIVPGTIQFWQHIMVLTLSNGLRLEFRYSAAWSITVDDELQPCFLFHMCEPPHIFEEIRNPIGDLFSQLRISGNQRPHVRKGPARHRLPCLNEVHATIAGSCLVYRIGLENAPVPGQYGDFMQRLRKARAMPTLHHHQVLLCRSHELYVDGFRRLKQQLETCTNILPFTVSFQVQKLAQDGYLPPGTVVSLLDHVIRMKLRSNERVCVGALRRLFTKIPYAGPDTESQDLSLENIVALLKENEDFCTRQEATQVAKSGNVAVIHRAKITPSSIHLYGPEPESNNRVLRKYPNNHDSFLRVQFFDENGGPVNFDPKVSLEKIYQGRFKDILHKGIQIAGRDFKFLGFSHSSLRSHSCWFVAPFMHKTRLWGDREIIEDLGDFSMIRSPAKCAARIGQAFSDTRTAISIPLDFLKGIPDVERNGRVFSDGAGTMSPAVMDLICEHLPKQFDDLQPKPTCLQIRFQGAKGMISLDCRLPGNVFNLRPSMVKFSGSNSWDVEICEAAYRPLPAFLNRQFIKILEDMGVPYTSFLKLQTQEVRRLKTMTNNPWDVSKFLHRQSIGQSMNLARFVQELAHRNIDFRQDPFLRNVLEAALLIELRLLKHKTRIPVSEGQVLHGIMDETGCLEEGQVFCTYNNQNGQAQILVRKGVLVSRAPALHSGDVQLVEAVKPPRNSPLRKLSNCICFSQKGSRDLPSQLSGGDLDGDLYLVIWDRTLLPTQFFQPADYPRIPALDIGRSVTRADMTEFFIQFMETDQLGRIATRHVQLADRGPLGTREADCITLAGMHSTAVDFSKTGIPVDMSQLPPSDNWRPDFMAPGPHVKVETNMGVVFDEEVYMDPQENWDENEDNKGYRYYESNKILGRLYRAIDERDVLEQIQDREATGGIAAKSVVIDAVWKYVKEKCRNFQWEHQKEKAQEIRDMYEECVLGIMTEYSDHPTRPLSELEAFIGNIIGKTGALGRHQRDTVKTLKEKIKEDTTYIINCILKDGDEPSEEALERSIACLAVSMEERPASKRAEQPIYSFKYIAAAVAMREAEKLPGFEVLPPLDLPMWLTYGGL